MKLSLLIIVFLSIFMWNCNIVNISSEEKCKTIKNLKNGIHQTIVLFGTSLTYGGAWTQQIKTALQEEFNNNVTVVNSGKTGETSRGGLLNIYEKVLIYKPDCVILEFAINDMIDYMSPEMSSINLSCIIDRIQKENPVCEVILMTMNPRTDGRATILTADTFYNIYRDISKKKDLILIDNYLIWRDIFLKDIALYSFYIPDGCHPSALACEKIVTPHILDILER